MKNGLLSIGCFILFLAFGYAQQNNALSNLNQVSHSFQNHDSLAFELATLDAGKRQAVQKEVSNGLILSFKEDWRQSILDRKPKNLSFSLLSPEGNLIRLDLSRTSGALDNASIRLASSDRAVNAPNSAHYKGEVRGIEGSSVGLSFLENEVMGVFFWSGHSYTLGKLKSQTPEESFHIFYPNTDLLLDFPDLCHITEEHDLSTKQQHRSEASNSDNCVHTYFEVTHDIYLDKGDLASTLDYINGALSQVNILFENEDINWEVSEILVWDVPDPYDGPSSGDYLVQFRNELNGVYNGDIAALLGYGGGGGVAYLDVLCNNFWGVSYSGIGSSYNEVPEYSWTIMVISHEIGHNIGSPHTHACFWNGDDTMIDGCGPEAGYPQNPGCTVGPLPPTGGTVMSYCHLIGGVGIDLAEGFHPQVADLFEDKISNASCLGTCESFIPTADFGVVETQLCEGATVQFYSLASENTTEWDWSFPGGNPSSSSEENPVVTYSNSGTYDVTLTVTSGAGETDELVQSSYISVDNNGSEVLVYQDFENGLGDYTINNGSGPGFEITTSSSGSTYGSSTLWLDNYNNSNGDFDELLSPQFSLLAYNSATLYIDYAVTRRNNVSDSLVIYASRDGGATFEHVVGFFETGSGTYSTHSNTNDPFTPENADQWCLSGTGNSCLAIDLSAFTREDNVQIQIRNKHFGGNNLFIDRVWVQTDCYDLEPPVADFSASPEEGCVTMLVNFTDLSSQFPQSHDWIFDGGTPNNSSEPNPTIIYDEPGEYAVTLTVSNPEGTDSETKIAYIKVGDIPTADFDVDIVERTVDFTYTGVRANAFDWDFGDGAGSTDEDPTHTYAEDGEYTVQLTVTNDCGTDSMDFLVEISTLPVAVVDILPTEGCEPMSVVFNARGSGNTEDYYWEFEGGSPATSTEDSVTVTYSDPGNYDVLFIATNENGHDTVNLADHILVDPLPHANFSTSINDLTVTFYNLSQDYSDVFWDFGDGQSTSSNSPEYTYEEPGTYIVQLIASNDCGSDTSEQQIVVSTEPIAGISANVREGCPGDEIQFIDQSSSNTTDWFWSFEGGTPSTSSTQEPVVTYNSSGTFDVTLIASSSGGTDTLTLMDYITIYDLPVAEFIHDQSGRQVTFTNLSNHATSFYWDFGDGNISSDENPVHDYAQDGIYDVELLAINQCDTSFFSMTLDVFTLPTAGFSSFIREGCADLRVEFQNESTQNALEFQWIFSGADPEISTEENPVVNFFAPGLHTVTLIVSNPSGADTLMIEEYIEVYPSPQPYFEFDVDSLTITFEDLSNYVDRYYWDFGDGQSDTVAQPVHTYLIDSTYEVTLMAMNECDTVRLSRTVATGGLPQTNFAVLGERLGCAPFTIELSNETEGNVEEYQWLFPGGSPDSSATSNPSVTYDSTGIYSITLIAYNSNGSNQYTLQNAIRVIESPFIDFTVSPQSDFTFSFESDIQGEEITDIQWFFGDGNTSSEADPVHTYEAAGEYEAMLVVSNLCGRDTASQVIQIQTTSVTSFEEQSVQVYPNPAQDRVFISPWPAGARIEIHNNLGAVEQLSPLRSDKFLSVNHLPAGMYFIHIIRDQDRIVAPLIIQR